MEMAWPLVSWIMSASSSSSSSSSECDYDVVDDSDYNEAESPNDDVSCDDSVSPSAQSPCCQVLPLSIAAAAADPSSSTSKRRRTGGDDVKEEAVIKRVSQKRVWNKEDELELLHGFLDHVTKSRRISKNGRLQKDYVSSFYNEVKPELQLRFNKSQIVEKLRRLKRKYNQNIVSKRNLGFKDVDQLCFKSSHDKATFEISHRIWNRSSLSTDHDQTVKSRFNKISNSNSTDEAGSTDTTGLIMGLGGLNYPIGLMKFGDGEVVVNNGDDEKWREQRIMELEVYLKRLELVQAQVRAALDKLRSAGPG